MEYDSRDYQTMQIPRVSNCSKLACIYFIFVVLIVFNLASSIMRVLESYL